MRFAHELILWLLLGTLPVLTAFLVWASRRRQFLLTQFVQARLLPQLTVRRSAPRERLRLTLIILAVTSLFLTLARPQWGFAWQEIRQRGLDIVVAIDTSRSMLAQDLTPNRLARSKLAALDLLRLARTDRLGLVAFAGTAFLQCPLTLDDEAFCQSVDALDTGIIPQGGTALTAAIETALAAFKDENNFKILVLLSDGEDHDSGALAAAQRARQAGLRIFTLGVGTPAGDILRAPSESGASTYIKDADGNVVQSRLNETLLQEIATATAGFYLPLRDAQAINTLYQTGLAPLPKADLSARLLRQYHEQFYWPLALAVLLLLVEPLIPHAKTPSPMPAPGAATKGGAPNPLPAPLATLLALAATLSFAVPTHASARDALRAYEQGDFETANREYRQLLERRPDDARLLYNAGTAAYRAGQLDAAARALTNALNSSDLPLRQRSLYNLGNTLYQLGEHHPEFQQKTNLWTQAVRNFEAAHGLDPQDTDAVNNRDFVKRRLEELLQQQKQQQQQPQPQPENSSDKPEEQPASRPQPQPQDPNSKPPSSQTQEAQPQSKPQEDAPPPKPDPHKGTQDQEKPNSSPQPRPGSEQNPDTEQTEAAQSDDQPAAPGQMSPREARQLLDAQKGEERALRFLLPITNRPPARILKDW